jgi:hypothetical protein
LVKQLPRTPIVVASCLLTLFSAQAAAQFGAKAGTSVDISLSRNYLIIGEDLDLNLTISGPYDHYSDPTFEGFEFLGRTQQRRVSLTNGRMTQEETFVYRLAAKRAGIFSVGSVKVYQQGKVVAKSKSVAVKVGQAKNKAPVSAQRAQKLSNSRSEDIFLQAEIGRTSYYVGEPFAMVWNLNFKPNARVQSIESVSPPKLEGLLTEELLAPDRQPSAQQRQIGGQRFNSVPQSVRLCTGLRPGKVVVDSTTIRVLAGGFFRQRRHVISSDPYIIQLLPLPKEGRPDEFEPGHIGRFTLKGSLRNSDGRTPTHVQTGERLVFELEVRGHGALVSLKAPTLDGGDKFEIQMLPSSSNDEIEKDTTGMHGKRVFQYLLTPRKPGEYTPPRARFSFFDPTKKAYQTLSYGGAKITVAGRSIPDGASTALLAGEDIGPNVDRHVLSHREHHRLAGTPLFWLLLAFPAGLFAALESRHRLKVHRNRNPALRRSKGAFRNAAKRLGLAQNTLDAGLVKDFYGQMTRTLESYFEERANIAATGLTHEELRLAMIRVGYGRDLVEEVIVELENSDFARFAPAASADEQMKTALSRMRTLLDQLDAINPQRKS